jgi:hypothetical protein
MQFHEVGAREGSEKLVNNGRQHAAGRSTWCSHNRVFAWGDAADRSGYTAECYTCHANGRKRWGPRTLLAFTAQPS